MKRIFFFLLVTVLSFLSGCDILQSTLTSAYNLSNCEYKYNSLSNLSLSGINLSNGLTPLLIPKVLSIINGQTNSIPLNFTLNIDVKNPNTGMAAFQALNYIISVDDVKFTSGNFNKAFSVGAGEQKILPMDIGLDIAELMTNNSKDAVLNIVKNFLGLGNTASKVSVQLKPSFKVGEQTFTSPVYIPVNFSFGGK